MVDSSEKIGTLLVCHNRSQICAISQELSDGDLTRHLDSSVLPQNYLAITGAVGFPTTCADGAY